MAGKTGTAQRVGTECGCYDGTFTVSFAGFAPADDPRFLVYVVVQDPAGGGGGSVGGPAFQQDHDPPAAEVRRPADGLGRTQPERRVVSAGSLSAVPDADPDATQPPAGDPAVGARRGRWATTSSAAAADVDAVDVTGLTLASQRVRPGDLYAAPAGARAHGASFAADAVDAGAVAVLTDPAGAELCRRPGRAGPGRRAAARRAGRASPRWSTATRPPGCGCWP